MAVEINNRFADADLAEFKTLILGKIKKAQRDLSLLKAPI